jgi:hypothetical protein
MVATRQRTWPLREHLILAFLLLPCCSLACDGQRPKPPTNTSRTIANPARSPTAATVASRTSVDDTLAAARRCSTNPRLSRSLSFQPVHLGRVHDQSISQERFFPGPAARRLVVDSASWPAIWRELIDTSAAYPIAFGNDAIILVATRVFGNSPTRVRVSGVRQCISTSQVIVQVELTRDGDFEDIASRAFAAARISRALLNGSQIVFLDVWPPLRRTRSR